MLFAKKWAGLAALAAIVTGCGTHYTVTRVVDGRVYEGRFIEPDAYASYLRGAVAEGRGEYRAALAEYENAAKLDDEDPEIWTRIADVRCKLNPKDIEAQYAVARALLRDEEYGPAWVVRASCEITRGVDRVQVEQAAMRGAEVDPRSTKSQVLLARVEDSRSSAEARNRLVALTVAAGNDAEAWLALASWAESHGDADLESSSFSRVAELSPTKWKAVADAAVRLAGDGALRQARSLSASLADAELRLRRADARQTFSISHAPLVARMALDEALLRGAREDVEARASLGRIDVDEIASRAALLDRDEIGKAFVAPVIAADPSHRATPRPLDAALPGDTLVNDEAARQVALGKVDRSAVSEEAAIEADVRLGRTPPALDHADARHRLLACAFSSDSPQIPANCEALAKHVAPFGTHDTLVAVSLAELALRAGRVKEGAEKNLVAIDPSDPLVLRVAKNLGPSRR